MIPQLLGASHMAAVDTFAGTSGRVQAVAVSPVLTTDTITFSGTPATVAEAYGWRAQVQKTDTKFVGFESDANAQGVVFEQQLRGGIGSWSASIEVALTAAGAWAVGQALVVDLLAQKGADTGYEGLNCVIRSFSPGTGVNQPFSTITVEVAGSGVWPATPS